MKEGLYFDENSFNKVSSVQFLGYTDQLDRYYAQKQGIVSTGEKPRLMISDRYKMIIRNLECLAKSRFTLVTTTLLGLHSNVQNQIISVIEMRKIESKKDGRDKFFFIPMESKESGLFFAIRTNSSLSGWNEALSYVQLRMYSEKFNLGILIMVSFFEELDESYSFEICEKNGSSIISFKKN